MRARLEKPFQIISQASYGFPNGMASTRYNKQLLPSNTVPEFYSMQWFHYDYHLVFYCHDSENFFASTSEAAHNYREGKARDFMNRLQMRLKLRQGEMMYCGTTEFGKAALGHLHILVSFDPLREKQKHDKIKNCRLKIQSQVAAIRKQMFSESIKVGIEKIRDSQQDQQKMLSYVCKIEIGRDYKHCFFSKCIKTLNKN
jgi:hypothetical protein